MIANSPSIRVTSSDADQGSHTASAYRGTPIRTFPDDMSALDIPIGVHTTTTDVIPVSQIDVPGSDPMMQLLQGLQTMFTKQDQEHIVDRAARQRFEATIQALVSPRQASLSSDDHMGPNDVPPGQYYDAPQASITDRLVDFPPCETLNRSRTVPAEL
jgi:hypothetical protein